MIKITLSEYKMCIRDRGTALPPENLKERLTRNFGTYDADKKRSFIKTDTGHTLLYGKGTRGPSRASTTPPYREVPVKIILACGSGIFTGNVIRHGAAHLVSRIVAYTRYLLFHIK